MTTMEANDLHRSAAMAFAGKIAPRAHELGVSKVVLFGSTARGTATEDSDVDVLVLLKGISRAKDSDHAKFSPLRREICDLSADVNEEFNYDTWVSPVIYGDIDYDDIRLYPLRRNIEREGITLYAD